MAPTLNSGAVALRAWRSKASLTPGAAAKHLQVDRSMYQRWEAGRGAPSLAYAVRLEDKLGIQVRAWLDGSRGQGG